MSIDIVFINWIYLNLKGGGVSYGPCFVFVIFLAPKKIFRKIGMPGYTEVYILIFFFGKLLCIAG